VTAENVTAANRAGAPAAGAAPSASDAPDTPASRDSPAFRETPASWDSSATPAASETPLLHTQTVQGGPGRAVFVHGLFGRGKNFTTAAKAIADTHTSLLVDLPNHGESPWTERFSYVDMAHALARTLREGFAADGPVDVIGHSMGGKTVMVLALLHPDLVRRLVVVDISPTQSPDSEEFPHLLGALAGVDLTALRTRADADALLQEPIPNPVTRGFLLQNLRPVRRGETGASAGDASGAPAPEAAFRWQPNLALLRAELPAVASFPDMEGRTFSGPVLWVGGTRSPYVTPEAEPAMRALFPRERKVMVKGSGHWVHSEKPEEFAGLLRAFLTAEG
jgi:pimeloyl-ACP methyl ester carboxylesterase